MNKRKVPKIRFKGFYDDWEQRKAKELFVSTADKGYPELPVLSATQDRGMIRRDENSINIFHDKKNEAGYKRVLPGQFVIHLRSFQGGFAHSAIEGITSPAYTVFGFSEPEKHDSEYWKYMFTSKSFIRRLETVTYGIRDGRSISYEEFLTLSFVYPSKAEQTAIARYLDKLSDLITLHQRKLEKLKIIKKSMLENCFPENGEKVPKIRSSEFSDDWEQREFGDYNDLMTGYPFESDKFSEDGIKLVRGMNVKRGYLDFSEDICMRWNSCVGLENFLLKAGDILIQMDGALIGKSYAKIKENQLPALLVQRVTRSRTNNKFASQDFMYQTIQRDFLRYIEMSKTETAVPHLSLNDIRNFEIMVPCLVEQEKIGAYFSAFDRLITLHQSKLEKLKMIKKSMLETMFV